MQQGHRRINVAHFCKGGCARHGQGKQLHRGRGNHAQRAFRANEQIPQIIAGVVLAQPAEHIQHPPAHQHNFKAKRQLTRGAIAHDIQPARIGAQIATDRAAALCRQIQRKIQPLLFCFLVQGLQHTSCLDGHRHVCCINLADTVHPAQ